MLVWSTTRFFPGPRYPSDEACRLIKFQKCYLSRGAASLAPEIQLSHRRTTAQPVIKQVKQTLEHHVRPHSLRQTLEEHRKANQDGRLLNHHRSQVTDQLRQQQLKKVTALDSASRSRQKGYKRVVIAAKNSGTEDYGGVSASLTQEWKALHGLPRGLRTPWVQSLLQDQSTQQNVSARRRLLAEMQAVRSYLTPTVEEDTATQRVLESFLQLLSSTPECRDISIKLIGSRATGIHNPLSDIDLAVSGYKSHEQSKESSALLLGQIYKLMRHPMAGESLAREFVAHKTRKGRVPLIDCEHISSGLQLQVQCTNDDYDAIEIVKAYLAEFPALGQIYHIIKQMLHMRGLSNGMTGGISSYPLFHMVVASLKLRPNNTDPASQLLGFLDLYAEIDFYTTAIEYCPTIADRASVSSSLRGLDPLSLQPILVPRRITDTPYLMSLQDPANLENDLGRVGTLIKHVQATFIQARQEIRSAMQEWDHMYEQDMDMKLHGKPILGWCLEGNYTRFEEQRRQLRS